MHARSPRPLPSPSFASSRRFPTSPMPVDGEHVILWSHFLHGFGLPVSSFLCLFLTFYKVQPHHLTLNMVLLLSAFVTLCEGYLGVLPTLELWGGALLPQTRQRRQGRGGPVRGLRRGAEFGFRVCFPALALL